MADVPQVTIVDGIPTGGTGTVETNSQVIAAINGTIADGDADSGNSSKVGGIAKASLAAVTLDTAGDRVPFVAGTDRVLIVRPYVLEDIVSGVAAITDGSSTSVIASSGAGVKTYITSCFIANTSATAVTVDLRDGAAGTVKATLPVPANTSGVVINLPVPLAGSAATAWCADPSAAASTITVTLVGFKSKV